MRLSTHRYIAKRFTFGLLSMLTSLLVFLLACDADATPLPTAPGQTPSPTATTEGPTANSTTPAAAATVTPATATPTPTSPAAAETPAASPMPNQPSIQIESGDVTQGAAREIPIVAFNIQEPGLAGFDFIVSYDPSVIEIQGVSDGADPWTENTANIDQDAGEVRIVNAAAEGVTGSFVIAALQIEAVGNLGQSSTLTVSSSIFADPELNEIDLQIINGAVTIAQ